MFKRKGVSFNLDCPHQKEVYEWATTHPNFSGFVKAILFKHYQNNNLPVSEARVSEVTNQSDYKDLDLVSDLI